MLSKLFKYDFKWINKVMIIYYIIAALVTIFIKVLDLFEKTAIVIITDKIFSGILISCFASILITCLMRIWVRYKNNIYKDESYLTHTLPITKGQIFNAKILSSIVSILISIFVIVSCLVIVYLNETSMVAIKNTFNNLANVYGRNELIGMIAALFCIIVLEIIYMMFAGIFGITIGCRANNYKALKSVLVGLFSYGFLSLFTVGILFIIAQISPTMMELFTKELPSSKAIQLIIYVSLLIYLIYDLGYYITSKKMLEKGVNVD